MAHHHFTPAEQLLGRKLQNITSVSLSTLADGYGTYDPETGTVEATTTLSVSYELGRGSSLTPRGSLLYLRHEKPVSLG